MLLDSVIIPIGCTTVIVIFSGNHQETCLAFACFCFLQVGVFKAVIKQNHHSSPTETYATPKETPFNNS